MLNINKNFIDKEIEKLKKAKEDLEKEYKQRQNEIRQMSIKLRMEYDEIMKPLLRDIKTLETIKRAHERFPERKEYRDGIRTKKSKIGLRKDDRGYFNEWKKKNEERKIEKYGKSDK